MRPILILLTVLTSPCTRASELELTYLVNVGFLISAGGDRVLIDAFIAEPYSVYLEKILDWTLPLGDFLNENHGHLAADLLSLGEQDLQTELVRIARALSQALSLN